MFFKDSKNLKLDFIAKLSFPQNMYCKNLYISSIKTIWSPIFFGLINMIIFLKEWLKERISMKQATLVVFQQQNILKNYESFQSAYTIPQQLPIDMWGRSWGTFFQAKKQSKDGWWRLTDRQDFLDRYLSYHLSWISWCSI